jgi:hydroxyacylglutathione hydrolase
LSVSPLHIETFGEPMFGENTYLVTTSREDGAVIGWAIDPGFPPAAEALVNYTAAHQVLIEKILLTHGHGDHIAGVDAVYAAHPQAQVGIAPGDLRMLTDPRANLSSLFGVDLVLRAPADLSLTPGMNLALGPYAWQVLDTLGHSPGGISLYCPAATLVFTGDALFPGSVGRTDFPGSNARQLIANIRRNLLTLPDDTAVYAGHGPPTTIGIERKSNPFLAE